MDGTLLCRVLELLTGAPIEGVQKKPRAPGHMLLNHTKAVAILRKNPLLLGKITGSTANELVRGAEGTAIRCVLLLQCIYSIFMRVLLQLGCLEM